jgi:hypothetical protein
MRISIIKCMSSIPRNTMPPRSAAINAVDETPLYQQTPPGITCSNAMPPRGRATLKVTPSSDSGDPGVFPWNTLAGGGRS